MLLEISEQVNANILSEISFGEEIGKQRSQVQICYPDKKETVWDVAKRYAEPLSKIKIKNNISETDSIAKKKFLIV